MNYSVVLPLGQLQRGAVAGLSRDNLSGLAGPVHRDPGRRRDARGGGCHRGCETRGAGAEPGGAAATVGQECCR